MDVRSCWIVELKGTGDNTVYFPTIQSRKDIAGQFYKSSEEKNVNDTLLCQESVQKKFWFLKSPEPVMGAFKHLSYGQMDK